MTLGFSLGYFAKNAGVSIENYEFRGVAFRHATLQKRGMPTPGAGVPHLPDVAHLI